MNSTRTRNHSDIHRHPAFRGLVADLKRQSTDQVGRCMEYLEDERTADDAQNQGTRDSVEAPQQ
jgi:hypothetical protein